jgi:hypothetical protein
VAYLIQWPDGWFLPVSGSLETVAPKDAAMRFERLRDARNWFLGATWRTYPADECGQSAELAAAIARLQTAVILDLRNGKTYPPCVPSRILSNLT